MGFFSKAISVLLGEKKKEPRESKEGLTEMEAAVIHPPLHVKARAEPQTGEERQRSNSRSRWSADGEHGTIYHLISKAYSRTATSFAKRMQDRRFVALAGVSLAVLITLLSYTSFFLYVRGIILAIIFILLAAASKLIQKFFPFVTGFDLCLFFTVLFGVAYHPFTGIIVGVASSALGSIARGQYNAPMVLIPISGYIMVGLLLMVMPSISVFYLGIIMTLIYTIMMVVIFWPVMNSLHNTVTFLLTSIAFNYWLFNNYASYFLMLMGFNA